MKTHSSEYKLLSGLFFKLLPYQILLLIVNAANSIVDSLHASNFIGKQAMSAMGLYASMDHFLYAMSIMLVSGSQLLCARFLGKNQKESVEGIFSIDLVFSAVLSLATSLVLVIGALTDVLRGLIPNDVERTALNQYVLGMSIGIPALVLGQQLFAFLSLENRKKRTATASIVCIIANIAMDAFLVIVLKMGTFGLGLASALALWAFFGVQAAYYISGKSDIHFNFKTAKLRQAWQIVRIGYPGAISRFVEMFRCIIVNILVLRCVGSIGVSSFAAVNSVMAVFWPVPFGMVAVMRMMMGVSIGEEDRRSLVDIMHVMVTRGMLLVTGIVVMLVLLAEPITCMFYRDPADPIYRMTIDAFRILPLCMPFSVISLGFTAYAQAMEKKKMAVSMAILDGAVGVVVCSLILIPAMGMNGLYISNVLNGIICCVAVVFFAWLSLKRFPRTLEDIMAIPESFGAGEKDRIDISVRKMEEVVDVSRRVINFCTEHGIDERRASFAGLAMEEMAGNVVDHGFTKDRKNHSIDIRVTHRNHDVILRLRDDCIPFNPSESAALMTPADGMKNVGLRIVYSLATEIKYQNLLGTNVLTIRM